jgi:tetratricopeptide (TPR) repeat protein/transcriptional regulator with XRE-family HTH domain
MTLHYPPNELFRAARLRLPSPSGFGPMSREELADVANQYLRSKKDADGPITADMISRIEQGRTAWPRANRRAALRKALGMDSDGAIGLFNRRRRGSDSSALTPATTLTGELSQPETAATIAGVVTSRGTILAAIGAVAAASGGAMPLLPDDLVGGRDRLAVVDSMTPRLREPSFTDDDDHVPWPCLTTDGRIVHVLMPRRTLFAGIAGVALGGATGLPRQPAWTSTTSTNGFSPVEAFRNLRAMLVDQDNIAGAGHVLPSVEHQLAIIDRLRRSAARADGKALLGVQAEYAEFAGWLAQDLGKFKAADMWLSRALGWAHTSGKRSMVTYILARKSQLAGDMADPLAAIDMADAAQESSAHRGRLAAASSTYAAYGYALVNDAQAMDRAIKTAREQLHHATEDPDPSDRRWAPWLDTGYIDVQAGRCHAHLGQHEQAVTAYQSALDRLPPTYRRDRGVYLARQAFAHAQGGDSTQAGMIGLQAVGVVLTTGSNRIITELVRVHDALENLSPCPAADEFAEALRSLLPALPNP